MILTGKTALVTGSTSGIGRGVAAAMAAEGAAVAVNGFGEADAIATQLDELRTSGAPDAWHEDCDLTDVSAIEAMFGRLGERGGVDVLVNNAGTQFVSPVEDFPTAKWDLLIGLNLSAPFHTCRLAVPGMKAKGWGRIIGTASAHSLVASPAKAPYVASKHGLVGLTKSLALELATSGVTANTISPGYVWTPLVEGQIPDTMAARGLTREQVMEDVLLAAQPTKRFVTPEQVAALAVFLCREEAANITGANLSMDGGWTAQ